MCAAGCVRRTVMLRFGWCLLRAHPGLFLWWRLCWLQALEVCAEKKKRILLIQQEIRANPVSHKRTGDWIPSAYLLVEWPFVPPPCWLNSASSAAQSVS